MATDTALDDPFDPVFDKQYRMAQIVTAIGFGAVTLMLIIFWKNPVAIWLALGIAVFGALQILMFQVMRNSNNRKKQPNETAS